MAKQTEEFWVKFGADNSKYDNAMKGSKQKQESFIEGENKVKRALSDTASGLLKAGNAAEVLSLGAEKLSEAFKSSLFVGGAIAVGYAMKAVFDKEVESVNKLTDQLAELGKFDMSWQTKSFEQLAQEIDKSKKAAEDFAKKEDEISKELAPKRWGMQLMGGGSQKEREEGMQAMRQAAQDQEKRSAEQMLHLEEQRHGILDMQLKGNDSQAAKALQNIERTRELMNMEKLGGKVLVDSVKERYAIEDKIAAKKAKDVREEIVLQGKLRYIIKAGDDSELAAATALRDARKKASDENTDPEKTTALRDVAMAAQDAYEAAKRRKALDDESMSSEMRIIQATGDADEKHLAALKEEERFLRWKYTHAKPDDRPGINKELWGNYNAQGEFHKQAKNASLDDLTGDIGANKGFGPTEELAAQRAILEVIHAKQLVEFQSSNFDSHKLAALRQQEVMQRKAIAQLEVAHEIEDAALDQQEAQLNIEAGNTSEAAKRYNITKTQIEQVDREIIAQKGLNNELARSAELRKKGLENDLNAQDKALNMGKSEHEVRMRQKDEADAKKQADKFDQKRAKDGGLMNVHRGMDGQVIGGTNPVTGDKVERAPTSGLDRKLDDFDTAPRLADQFKKASDAFRKKFKGQPDDPLGNIAAPIKTPGSSLEDLGTKLDEIKNAIITAIAK